MTVLPVFVNCLANASVLHEFINLRPCRSGTRRLFRVNLIGSAHMNLSSALVRCLIVAHPFLMQGKHQSRSSLSLTSLCNCWMAEQE
jgi:hypothetical protein